jgi:hypothetical protein
MHRQNFTFDNLSHERERDKPNARAWKLSKGSFSIIVALHFWLASIPEDIRTIEILSYTRTSTFALVPRNFFGEKTTCKKLADLRVTRWVCATSAIIKILPKVWANNLVTLVDLHPKRGNLLQRNNLIGVSLHYTK